MAALIPRRSANFKESSFAPSWPPRVGITEVPSSATTTTAPSADFSLIEDANNRMRIPSAPTKTIVALSLNRSFKCALKSSTIRSHSENLPWISHFKWSASSIAVFKPDQDTTTTTVIAMLCF